MQTALLYKLVLLVIAIAAFFLHGSTKYRHRVRTALYTATALMTILYTNEAGFLGGGQALLALGVGVGLGWCFNTGLPAFVKRYFPKQYWRKSR